MAECSKCGDKSMTFTCKYCGEKFCSKHRLPENHDCESMEEEIEKQKEKGKNSKWFREDKVKNPAPSQIKKEKRKKNTVLDDIKSTLMKNYTLGIIGITVLVFIAQQIIGIGAGSSEFYDLLVLQPGLEQVIFQPWTLITVMFLHANWFHLFANMVTLYFFGTAVEKSVGSKEFLKFYFASGLAASIGFVLFRNLLTITQGSAALGPAVGASGAVVAMFAVVAMLYPDAEVLLYFIVPMKIKTALYAFGGFELFNLLAKSVGIYLPVVGGFASSAHLAGLAAGIWYGKKLQNRYKSKTNVFNPLGY